VITLITGTPGAGKTLYAVWELARHVPGSYIEDGGRSVPRRLFSNINGLLVDHQKVDADSLRSWPTWAQPGDVILFDEVQEIWRPRSVGSKVPDDVAKLEVHRHMGVDFILVTQHPMLLDQNIRRLVNQHIHVRRILNSATWLYEWDHAENPGNTKTALSNRPWRYPKKAFQLYKSAQLHTKSKARFPAVGLVGVALVAALIFVGPFAYSRLSGSLTGKGFASDPVQSPVGFLPVSESVSTVPVSTVPVATGALPAALERPAIAGCIHAGDRCDCFLEDGRKADVLFGVCLDFTAHVHSVDLVRKSSFFPKPSL